MPGNSSFSRFAHSSPASVPPRARAAAAPARDASICISGIRRSPPCHAGCCVGQCAAGALQVGGHASLRGGMPCFCRRDVGRWRGHELHEHCPGLQGAHHGQLQGRHAQLGRWRVLRGRRLGARGCKPGRGGGHAARHDGACSRTLGVSAADPGRAPRSHQPSALVHTAQGWSPACRAGHVWL